MHDYIERLAELIPAIAIAIFGGAAGEIIRNENGGQNGNGNGDKVGRKHVARILSYIIVWSFAGIMAWALIYDMAIQLGGKVLIIGMSAFLSKEFLSALSAAFLRRMKRLERLEKEKGNGGGNGAGNVNKAEARAKAVASAKAKAKGVPDDD